MVKILFVARLTLSPQDPGGGELRVFNLLKHLSQQHEVSLLLLSSPSADNPDGVNYLQTFCRHVELILLYKRPTWQRRWWLAQRAWRGEPPSYVDYYYPEMADRIRALTAAESFDIVDMQLNPMAPYIDFIAPTYRGRTVFSLHDIDFVRYRRIFAVEPNGLEKLRVLYLYWLFSKRATLKYARRFDQSVVVSEADRDVLKQIDPNLNIAVVPNGVDTSAYTFLQDLPTSPTLCYVGSMGYGPNIDAMLYFCQEIFPLIKQQVPEAKLLIVGALPHPSVQALASADITVTGYVESLVPYYQRSLVSIVPLRAGGGTRIKILDALALGRPVVSTTVGCEGLKVTHGEHLLIADTPADFAAQTIRLLNDRPLQQYLTRQGRQLVESTYDWRVIAQQLAQVYSQIGSRS